MNYGGLPENYSQLESSAVVILPVPYDGTSTWVKGADKGPEALLEASANMELYDIETNLEVFKQGIFTDVPVTENVSPESMAEAVYNKVKRHLKDQKVVVTIGGEHSVSIGAIKAHVEAFDKLTVLQIDAHTDLRQEYEGSRNNHACVMARVREWCPYVQVGIRSMDVDEMQYVVNDNIFYAKDIHDNNEWMDKVLKRLSQNVYLTFDLDAFDPSIMPSTGTPEPGGLGWYPVLKFLKKVIENVNLVGFDVVELCPDQRSKASDFLAAKLIYKILSYKYSNK